jgi:hypothetical protein
MKGSGHSGIIVTDVEEKEETNLLSTFSEFDYCPQYFSLQQS